MDNYKTTIMIQRTQKLTMILMWVFLVILYGLQIETRFAVGKNKSLIRARGDSTINEHHKIIANQDTIKDLLKTKTHGN
jgi:hypothetical protein